MTSDIERIETMTATIDATPTEVHDAPVTAEALAFKLRGGTPSLYLVETLGEWTGRQYERVYDADRWQEWIGLVKLPVPARRATSRELARMRELRRAIYEIAQAVRTGVLPEAGYVETVNRFARTALAAPQLSAAADRWSISDRVTHAQVLAMIALDAISLLGGPLRERIRVCARPRCPVLFVDRSRHGGRIWCSAACGSRSASAKYRLRLAGREPDEDRDFCVSQH